MLQQTTVSTVSNRFEHFMTRYPSIDELAQSTIDELLIFWKGLGYYNRAKNLHKAAVIINQQYGGIIPKNHALLLAIPGIGPYTASAICAIGDDQNYLCIDANLERVIARLFLIEISKGPSLKRKIEELFNSKKIFPQINKIGARKLNEALMDLGREICHNKKPQCHLCPLLKECQSFKNNRQSEIPLQKIKKRKSFELQLLRIVVWNQNSLLCYQKEEHEWLSGQLEIPTFIFKSSDPKLAQYPRATVEIAPTFSFKSLITKYRIQNHVISLSTHQWRTFCKNNKINPSKYVMKKVTAQTNLSTSSFKALRWTEIALVICWRKKKNQTQVILQPRIEEGPLHNKLEFPGGKLEAGESPLEAAKREFQEEVACTLSGDEQWSHFKNYFHRYQDRTVYLHTLILHDPKIQIAETLWHALGDSLNNIPKANTQIICDLLAFFNP